MTRTNKAYEEFLNSPLARNPFASVLHAIQHTRKKDRLMMLRRFARMLEAKQQEIGFKLSSRGWGYHFENEGVVTKDTFDKVEQYIKECRELGYLDVHFTADDTSRSIDGNLIDKIAHLPPEQYLTVLLQQECENAHDYYVPDYWEGEKYHIQLFVEKVDLKTLFEPVCKDYNIPICNARGQSDINARAYLIENAKWAANRGLIPVVLYCGDLDPYGDVIAKGLRDNLEKLEMAHNVDRPDFNYALPVNLKIDVFGLSKEFVDVNNIPWIDNLLSSSGKDMTEPKKKKNGSTIPVPDFITNWVKTIGKRKVEANALVARPEAGRQLLRRTIETYLNEDPTQPPALERFKKKREIVKAKMDLFKQEKGITEFLDALTLG